MVEAVQYIIPPGLILKRLEFEAHYQIAKGKPIIIVGDTGVGKTLFLHLFERFYREEHDPKAPILRINCAHFDDQLVRSELFGHKKGSFTGALADKEGLLKKADGGVLFMEEIGELPKDAQSKLLTVIEDGFFYRVGGTEPEKTSVQIVGTTNNPKNLRSDFWQRFMPFYVPPLYERREDILYYLYEKFPDLLKTLSTQEVLWLLTYNWPGNVRELERVARLLERNKKMVSLGKFRTNILARAVKQLFLMKKGKAQKGKDSLSDKKVDDFSKEVEGSFRLSQFLLAEEHEEFFSAVRSKFPVYEELKSAGIDVSLLEDLLKRYRVSLGESSTLAFPELNKIKEEKFFTHRYDSRLQVKQYMRMGIFEEARAGLDLFCFLFFQSPTDNKNLLDIKEGTSLEVSFIERLPKTKRGEYLKLAGSIFEYLSGVKVPKGKRIPEELSERRRFFSELFDLYPDNKFLALLLGREPRSSGQELDIWSMKYEDLLRFYYRGMVERAGGVQEHAARNMGVNYRTFRSRCQKLGLRFNHK